MSIIRSAISHTVQVSVFIFLVTLILVAVLETFGESAIEQFLRGNETLAVLGSALVGLIPNCSASVVITQLYLEGALQLAPMLAGTLISAGRGLPGAVPHQPQRPRKRRVPGHDVRHRRRLGPYPIRRWPLSRLLGHVLRSTL